MSSTQCPVCKSDNHHQFWYWEKEDKLMRDWALDTQVTFSICRDCSTIFQNPLVESAPPQDSGFGSWGDGDIVYPADEPLMWLKQFTPNGEKRGRVLEVYHQEKRFVPQLQQDGWDVVKSVSASDLLSDESSLESVEEEKPVEGNLFDVVICFEALNKQSDPVALLEAIYPMVDDEGGIYLEVDNPSVMPRHNKICLSSAEPVHFPFHALIFALHKVGFMNSAAEMCGKIRCFGKKIPPNPDTAPSQVMPERLWEHTLYRFQRNYYWAKVTKYLQDYITRLPGETNLADTARSELHQDQNMLQIVRDVCGGSLLLAQEVNELQNSLPQDWYRTMQRIFDIFKNDLALYDLFQVNPIPDLGLFEGVERFHYKEKMIYMTNEDYFQKYFSEEEAKELCEGIIRSGHTVCGHLSSFL